MRHSYTCLPAIITTNSLLLYTCTTAPVLQAKPQQTWLVRAKDNSFVVKLAELSLHWRKTFLVYGHKINCPEKTNSNHGADSAQYWLRTRNRFYPSTVQDNRQKIFYTTNSVLALLFFISLIAERWLYKLVNGNEALNYWRKK